MEDRGCRNRGPKPDIHNGKEPCANLIRGSAGNDAVIGTGGDAVISAGAGNDIVAALGGSDTVCLGPGDDPRDGGAGIPSKLGAST